MGRLKDIMNHSKKTRTVTVDLMARLMGEANERINMRTIMLLVMFIVGVRLGVALTCGVFRTGEENIRTRNKRASIHWSRVSSHGLELQG